MLTWSSMVFNKHTFVKISENLVWGFMTI